MHYIVHFCCTTKVFIYSADKCVCTHQLLKNRHFLRKLKQHRPFLSFLPVIAVVFFSFSECRSTIADFDSVLSLRASVRPELSVQGCLSERPPARDFGQGQPSAGPARPAPSGPPGHGGGKKESFVFHLFVTCDDGDDDDGATATPPRPPSRPRSVRSERKAMQHARAGVSLTVLHLFLKRFYCSETD